MERFKEKEKRQYLILMNHQTAFDQFFVSMAFYRPIYYVASEDLFSKGWVSSLIRFLVAPIPIKKQATDLKAVMTCMRVAKEGGTIAIFLIEGGYGVHPRWADDVRKGKMKAYVSRIIESEEYNRLSADELYDLLQKELYVNEAVADASFYHKNSAEYIERAMYVCPDCGLSEFYSKKDITECKKCGQKIQYLPTKEIKGVDFDFPFRFLNDWYEYQKNFVNQLNPADFRETPMYTEKIALSEVIKTPAADNLVYQNFPAIVFGFPMMLLATLAPEKPGLTMVLLVIFFIAMNIILFRSFIFKRKKKVE